MRSTNAKVHEVIVVGTGLAGLNFVDKYLETHKKIDVISPVIKKSLNSKTGKEIKLLPSQMRGEYNTVNNYFYANNLKLERNCKAIGALNFGGLSNYWGLQIDNYIQKDQIYLKKKTFTQIKNNFVEFLKRFNLVGSFNHKKKIIYKNNFNLPKELKSLNKFNNSKFLCSKPILAFTSSKNFKGDLNNLNEEKQKLTAYNIFKKIKKKNKIKIHNYYLQKVNKRKNFLELICRNKGKKKKFLTKKLVLATGTIATTKIVMDFLNIKKEVKIKHHPRLLSVFFSTKKLDFNLNFTPSLLQITGKSSKENFTADLRPGNKLITESIIDAFPYMRPFKIIINFLRKRLMFSNFLYNPSLSNVYLKKIDNYFKIYSKNKDIGKVLRKKNKMVFNFLLRKKLIFPIYKTFFPGAGADYHYFGSIPFHKSGKLAVNNNCQLLSARNIYIIDGSVFNFKSNKYPLGIVAANARRIAKFF